MAGETAAATAEPVRWGVLGTARITRLKVLPGMAGCSDVRVVAIASRDAGRARDVAAAHGIPRAYGSYEALLADPDVEVVYNALPNHLHVPWSVRAADAGRHVLCEKPIALNAGEARTLLAARERNGVLIGEAFMVRLHPQWLAVHDLVHSGRIGELRALACHFSYSLHDPQNIRSRPEWGGGGLLDIGCYAVHLSRWLFGAEPLNVSGRLERDPALGVDRLASGLLEFDRGHATFTCATQLVPHQRVHLLGTLARLEVEVPFNAPPEHACRILIDDGSDVLGSSAQWLTAAPADQYALQASAFSGAVRGRGTFPVPLEDSIANMQVIDALFRAAGSTFAAHPVA
jgi:predicted dehydrogenase